MASVDQRFEEILKEEFAKFDPATLKYLEQLLGENEPAVRKIVQNVLDEPTSQETEKRLQKPLLPNLTNQDLLPGKERGEKRKSF